MNSRDKYNLPVCGLMLGNHLQATSCSGHQQEVMSEIAAFLK